MRREGYICFAHVLIVCVSLIVFGLVGCHILSANPVVSLRPTHHPEMFFMIYRFKEGCTVLCFPPRSPQALLPWLWFSHALELVCFVEVALHCPR